MGESKYPTGDNEIGGGVILAAFAAVSLFAAAVLWFVKPGKEVKDVEPANKPTIEAKPEQGINR